MIYISTKKELYKIILKRFKKRSRPNRQKNKRKRKKYQLSKIFSSFPFGK